MRLTTWPSPRFSSAQRRCCGVMRNIVVQTQTLGSSEMTFRDRNVISLDPSVCVCTTMFRITPQHLLWALENLGEGHVVNRISVDERTRHYARVALDRMLSLR